MVSKKISIKDVAKMAGVSPGTVSNYLNHSAPVNEGTQKRIQKAIDLLGYRRNEIASSLRRSQSKTIGLILPDIRNPFYADFYYSIERAALNEEYNIVFGNSDYNRKKIEHFIELFISRRVDAIIVSGNYTYRLKSIVESAEIPIIVFEPKDIQAPFPSLGIDNIAASKELVNYMINKGHERIAVITSSKKSTRFMGYQKALEEHNMELNEALIHEFGPFSKDLFRRGYEAFGRLLEKTDFSACFLIADMLALGALGKAQEKGIVVPGDISIAGFDNIPFSDLLRPKLTTVAQPIEAMGEYAFNLCIDLLSEQGKSWQGKTKLFDTEVVVRESVKEKYIENAGCTN
jgi:LacI family transcriptional regulator